jgi:hypothetical protein
MANEIKHQNLFRQGEIDWLKVYSHFYHITSDAYYLTNIL